MLRWMLSKKKGRPEGQRFVWNLVAVTVGHKVYCFGGYCSKDDMNQLNVHVFNTVSSRWKKLPPAKPGRDRGPLVVPSSERRSFTAVLIEDVIYIWGGLPYCDVLYAFDVDAHRWFLSNISGSVPAKRWGHSACVLGKVMYILGGFNKYFHRYFNDMYKLDTTTMVWSFIKTRGTPALGVALLHHSATIIRTKMFIVKCSWSQDNSIGVFDTETNCWLKTPPSVQLVPEECKGHPAFAYYGELYILGDKYNGLWKFNPETLSWKKFEPKGNGPSQNHFKFK